MHKTQLRTRQTYKNNGLGLLRTFKKPINTRGKLELMSTRA